MQRQFTIALAITVTAFASFAQPLAQTKRPPAPSEWGQFESLAIQPRGGLSPDGKWLAFGINRSNRENELRVLNIASGAETTIAFGTQPVFSADSKWIVYAVGYSEAHEERLRRQRRPVQRKLGMLKLDGVSEPTVIEGIESFALDPTGERTKVAERVDDAYLQASPRGRFLLFLQNDQYWTVNTTTRAVVNITRSAATTFVDRESDVTVKQKPPFGVAGWTANDNAVLLYDKFDVWEVAADGSRATRLTDGAAEQVRHRLVRLDPDAEWIDTTKPLTFSLFGTWSKKSGYARRSAGGEVECLIFEDRAVGNLARAHDADVHLYVTQTFDDSPDAYVAGADLKGARQVTKTNAFMDTYAWGRSEVVEFRNERGIRLQGSLHYPAGYEPGKKYPMVVYLYEKLSDNVHRFIPPSERDYYYETAFTSQGYVFFQPDIVFRPREPGLSVMECVEPAVRKIVAMRVADPARVGVIGHSWGGFDASYLATHSNAFAAAVAGAAITDLVSNYGNHHWSSGIAETDHIETGQQRMEVPIYEDLQAYIRNSAVFNVHNMKTPLLLEVGDNDGTVHWHQGVELYNIARRAKKDVIMLAYGGEDHGLRRRANQIDYQRRIFQWFGHYLKSEPAAPWITSGLRYIERDREFKKGTGQKGS